MKPKVIFALFAIFAMQQAAADLFWVGDLLYKINEDGNSVNVVV